MPPYLVGREDGGHSEPSQSSGPAPAANLDLLRNAHRLGAPPVRDRRRISIF
jgi:hypothetical protein